MGAEKSGRLVGTFLADGEKVAIRYPKLSDYKALYRFYNKAIKESLDGGGYISRIRPVTLEEEKKWVKSAVEKNKRKESVHLIAVYNGKVIGSSTIEKENDDAHRHVGSFGISILEEFTGKGLGTRLSIKTILIGKKELKLEIAKLRVYGNNKRAKGLYKKLGFKEIGRVKKGGKIKGKYTEDIFMVKYL